MKVSPLRTSRPGHIVCPACGSGELVPQGSHLTVCDSCGLSTNGAVLRTLEQIAALPEGLGHHVLRLRRRRVVYLYEYLDSQQWLRCA